MSAELLRKAAKILRERANAATPGPWSVGTRRDGTPCAIDQQDGYDDVLAPGRVECSAYCYGGTSTIEANRDGDWPYIATMHPGVGLVLADVLDVAARRFWKQIGSPAAYDEVIALARLIVGEAS